MTWQKTNVKSNNPMVTKVKMTLHQVHLKDKVSVAKIISGLINQIQIITTISDLIIHAQVHTHQTGSIIPILNFLTRLITRVAKVPARTLESIHSTKIGAIITQNNTISKNIIIPCTHRINNIIKIQSIKIKRNIIKVIA